MAIKIGPSAEDTSAEARFQRAVRMYAGGPDNTHHDEIRGVVSPGVIQLKLILPELGAVWDEMPSTSRQGGGGERTNWRWPNGMSVPLEWMASLVGLLTMLKEWGAAVTMELDPDEKYPYWAQIHDNRARANSAWGAVMLACLRAGMRPGMKAPLFLPAGGPIKPPVGPPEEVHDQDYFARQQARHDAELGAAVALATKGLGHFAEGPMDRTAKGLDPGYDAWRKAHEAEVAAAVEHLGRKLDAQIVDPYDNWSAGKPLA